MSIKGFSVGGNVERYDYNSLDNLPSEITIDPALSGSSTNPVQNKVVTGAINATTDSVTALSGEVSDLKSAFNDEETAIDSLVKNYDGAVPIAYTVYSDRVKIYHAFYQVKNNIIYRYILLKITTDGITSANVWALANISLPVYYKFGANSVTYTATSLSGGDISNMTFSQDLLATPNLQVITTAGVTKGQGGVIMLTNSQPLNNVGTTLPSDTVYPQELINNTQFSKDLYSTFFEIAGRAWHAVNKAIISTEGYNCAVFRVLPNSSIMLKGLSETLGTIGYSVFAEDGTVLSSGGESNGMVIDIPANGYRLIVSYPTSDSSTLQLIPYFKKKIVVLGDSWSDNDPSHTTYTKWTTLLNQDGRYNVIVYAQNGSSISGDTPNYGLNGNVAGQMAQLKTDNVKNVDCVIIFGGINDFRSTVSASYVYSKVEEFYNDLNKLYPNARIIYLSNNQIYFTRQQLDYFKDIHDYLRTVVGMETFDTFGWVKAEHYIDDYVHVNNYGYKDIYANMLSILEGGSVHTILNKHSHTVEGNVATLDIWERFVDGNPEYIFKLKATTPSLNHNYDIDLTAIDKDLLASVPFCKILNKGYVSQIGIPGAVVSCEVAETFTTTSRLNTTNTIKLLIPSVNSGVYFSDNFN